MISFLRRFIDSKVGIAIMLVFLGLIALAFAMGDITGQGGLGQIGGGGSGGTVAKVGGEKIGGNDLADRMRRVFERERQENPTLTMGAMLDQGATDQVLNQLIAGAAISGFADDQGLGVSKRQIDAEIAAIPAFQSADGRFDQNMFRQQLARQNLSEKLLRDDIKRTLIGRQLLGPPGIGATLTDSMVLPYASLLLEQRQGRVQIVPSALFAPTAAPDDKTLAAFYNANASRFAIPEQRIIRYAVIDESRFTAAINPSPAELQAAYDARKSEFAAKQTRSFEQLILPTQAGAQAIAKQVAAGGTLADAAQKAGLSASTLNALTRDALAGQTSAQLATQAFGAAKGALVGPVKTALGWSILRVTDIVDTPGRSLDQVRDELVKSVREQKSHQLLSDFTAKIEDQAQDGATFDEIARDNKLTVETTPALLSTGKSAENPAYTAPADVAPVLAAAFDQELDGDPTLAPITPDKRYALVDVTRIIAAAPPPLAKVKDDIVKLWRLQEGAKRARAAADGIKARMDKGATLDAALAAAGAKLPPVSKVGGRRADLMRSQQVPPALALMFSIPAGATKVLDAGQNAGFFIVHLDAIKSGDAAKTPQLVNATRTEMQRVVGSEYAEQFERAVEAEMKVTRYPSAIDGVRAQLRRNSGN